MFSPVKVAYDFLVDLAPISESSITEGAECIICKVPFGTQPFEGCRLEHPTCLPCAASHIVGSECIKDWLSPGRLSHNHCPSCRQELFPPCESLVAATEVAGGPGMGMTGTTSDDALLTSGSDAGADPYQGPDMSEFELESGEIAPPGHPIRTLRQREIELYKRFRRHEGHGAQDPPDSGSSWLQLEAVHAGRESYMIEQLKKIGAFDDRALPVYRRRPSQEDFPFSSTLNKYWCLWWNLKREGRCWDLGPVAGQEGRKEGWYLD